MADPAAKLNLRRRFSVIGVPPAKHLTQTIQRQEQIHNLLASIELDFGEFHNAGNDGGEEIRFIVALQNVLPRFIDAPVGYLSEAQKFVMRQCAAQPFAAYQTRMASPLF